MHGCRIAPFSVAVLLCLVFCVASASAQQQPAALARKLLEHIRCGEQFQQELQTLQVLGADELNRGLDTENKKKAFWLNVYNGSAQLRLNTEPKLNGNRTMFFSMPSITVAGHSLSLDVIENLFIRRAQPGFLPRFLRPLFMSPFERRLSVRELDCRIHFALNCTARSCPPVLVYDENNLNSQLDAAMLHYITSSVRYVPDRMTVYLPELFNWYADDFGGRSGILKLLRRCGVIGPDAQPVFVYTPWDWGEPRTYE